MKDGLKKMNDLLAGVPMTVLGGFFLTLSFVLPRVGIALAVDPAWVTVFISGIPLLYLAVWRIIHNPGIRKISSALLITIAMFAAIAIGDLFAAGEVAFIMAVGAILEDMTTGRAKKGLKKLISLAPLQGRRMETVLLTGDNQMTADYFAGLAGISEVRAGLLPEEKVKNISELQESGRTVCMIGDGVNDAPALKTAAVGVAMGSMGSDIAVEAADIALIGDDISRLPYLKRLANAAMSTIKCSITLSMCINFAAVTLSVLGVLTPTTGALVHNAGSCFVVLIAALLYDRKFE